MRKGRTVYLKYPATFGFRYEICGVNAAETAVKVYFNQVWVVLSLQASLYNLQEDHIPATLDSKNDICDDGTVPGMLTEDSYFARLQESLYVERTPLIQRRYRLDVNEKCFGSGLWLLYEQTFIC